MDIYNEDYYSLLNELLEADNQTLNIIFRAVRHSYIKYDKPLGEIDFSPFLTTVFLLHVLLQVYPNKKMKELKVEDVRAALIFLSEQQSTAKN